MTAVSYKDIVSTYIKIPEFCIKRENYLQWEIKFKSFAIVKGYQDLLKRVGDPDTPASEYIDLSSDDETKKKGKLDIKQNDVAMSYIAQVMMTHRGISIIHKRNYTHWPDGLSHMVVNYLEKNMKPDDTVARVEFKREFNKIRMKNNDDPIKLIEK